MARQRNQAVFVFFVIMVLFAVSFVFSFPRENRYGLIPRRGMLSVYKLLKISSFPWFLIAISMIIVFNDLTADVSLSLAEPG